MWHARPPLDSDFASIRAISPGADLTELLDGIDRDRDATVVMAGGEVVAWAVLRDGQRYAGVAQSAHGQGIGSWLLRWSSWRAKAAGLDAVAQTTTDAETAAWLVAHDHIEQSGTYVLAVK